MTSLGLTILFIFLYLDILTLKKRNRMIFDEVFYVSPTALNLFSILTALLTLFSPDPVQALSLIAVAGWLPVYILRRLKYSKIIKTSQYTLEESSIQEKQAEKYKLLSNLSGVVIGWLLMMVLMEYLFEMFIHAGWMKDSEVVKLFFSSSLSSVVILILITRAGRKIAPQSLSETFGLNRHQQSFFKVYIVPALVGLFFAGISSWLVETRPVQPQTPLSELMEGVQSSRAILFFLFLAILIAPFVEEVVFRGYLFYVLNVLKGKRFAFTTVSLLFALLHVEQYWGDWLAITMVACLGFTLTFLRMWTNTTLASITAHYVYNAGVTLIPLFMLIIGNPAYFQYQAKFDSLDAQEKETLLLKSIKQDPDLADAYNDLAWLYVEQDNQLDTALELIEKALSYDPHQKAYLDTKAAILEKLGKLEESRAIRQFIHNSRKK